MAIKTAGDMLALNMLMIRTWKEGYSAGASGPDEGDGNGWAESETREISLGLADEYAELMPGEGDATDDQRDAIHEVCDAIYHGELSADDPKAIGAFLAIRGANSS